MHTGKMLVGLTGGFGTGKSTACEIFREFGAGVIDADRIAHEALDPSSTIYPKIKALFPEAVGADGSKLDRGKIAARIFDNAGLRKKLEALVHPYVFERMGKAAAALKEAIVILEIPLLYETGFDRYCEKVIVVNAASDAVRERLQKKGYSEKEIRERTAAQLPLSDKIQKADYVLDNTVSLQETKKKAAEIWKELQLHSKGE